MNILSIIKLFMSLALSLTQYAHDKKMMDAGAAESVLKGLNDANDAIARANLAREKIDDISIEEDDANRANKRVK